ncbi:MAG: hypothetical protein A2176_10155 [Spirochaetes bacterium RBG_13_51_14]|nr:MAG: hypothetical protein A2176_10155 [Spirochaetes bacterium RBG_13_51_14]
MFACSTFQEKDFSNTDSDTRTVGSTRKLIVGTWKIVAIRCDSQGSNCERYKRDIVFQFSRNGDLVANGTKRGTYRLEGSTCILDTDRKQYTVSIILIDSSRMITGEQNRKSTEIFNKIQ